MPAVKKEGTPPSPFAQQMAKQVIQAPPEGAFDPFTKVDAQVVVDASPTELPAVDLSEISSPPPEPSVSNAPEFWANGEELKQVQEVEADAPLPAPTGSVESPDRLAGLAAKLNAVLEAQRKPAPSETSAILSLLNPNAVSVLEELAARQGAPVEAVIAGLITHLEDQNNLGDFTLNPDWQNMLMQGSGHLYAGQAPVAIGGRRRTFAPVQCEGCGHAFTPAATHTQRFCCNECGKRAAGYAPEDRSHSEGCTTVPGKTIDQAWAQIKAAQAAKTQSQSANQGR